MPPLPVPVTVIAYVPAAVDAEVLTVRVEEHVIKQSEAKKDAVAPDGRPDTVRETFCGKGPDSNVAVILFCTDDP